MKILFFIHSLGGGGAERVMVNLANDWVKRGHDVSIAVNDTNVTYSLDERIELIHAKLDQKSGPLVNKLIGNIQRIRKYAQVMKDAAPDIIVSFTAKINISTIIAAKMAGIPIVISERNTVHALKSRVWRSIRRMVYPFSNQLIVLSQYDQKKYKYHSNVKIITNPVMFKENRNEVRVKTLLAVGRLVPAKGFDLLLKAFADVENKGDWKLVILGEGVDRNDLEAQINSLGISDNVELPGWASDVEDRYQKTSIFVLSSRYEGFPNVLCEAMGYGCAVIAFDCLTGPRDLIEDGVNGLLVAKENIEGMTNAIETLLQDENKRELIAENAKLIRKKLHIDQVSDKWLENMQNIIDEN